MKNHEKSFIKNVEMDKENPALIYMTVQGLFLARDCDDVRVRGSEDVKVDSQSHVSQFSILLWHVVIGYSTNWIFKIVTS